MSEQDFSGEVLYGAAVVSGSTAGSLLREARVAAGVHIESIAFALKVPVGKIEALEEDDFSVFPDVIFMRALASSVCRGLRIDSVPVLSLMPQGVPHSLAIGGVHSNAKFRELANVSRAQTPGSRHSKGLVLAVIVLVAGAAVVAWMPESWSVPGLFTTRSANIVPAASESDKAVITQSGVSFFDGFGDRASGAAVPAQHSVLDAEPAQLEATSIATIASQFHSSPPTSPTKLAAFPTSATSPTEVISSASARLNAASVAFKARGETWVQVVDQQKKIVLERILKNGESVAIRQPGPLAVVVGRADMTDVTVDGEPLDIVKSARDNVARFEVSQ